jgi:methyl-accepting chemotaxis protein
MKKLFKFKKMSAQITFMIGTIILIVAGGVAGYMQTRIITEIGRVTELTFLSKVQAMADGCNSAILDAAYRGDDNYAAAMEDSVKGVTAYKTGFGLISDDGGNFYETNDLIRRFSSSERAQITGSARANQGKKFEVRAGGNVYIASSATLYNGYEVYIIAPKSEVNAELTASLTRFSIIFIVLYSIVLVVAHHIGKNMGKPIAVLSAFMGRAGKTGNIKCSAEEERAFEEFSKKGGEIGRMIENCGIFIDHVIYAAGELETVAGGDLTNKVKTLSSEDVMAVSLNKMIDNLTDMFSEITASSAQVATGSSQIADSSQSLAQGSTQQAAAVEELSSSIAVIVRKTTDNAERANKAATLADTIKGNAERGSRQMDEMMNAVKEISAASQSISKVIKSIDDIAFQTNILALNAAVEAARAGQHGKGFAVVAEEVRSLASKSADAAKETGVLIQNSVEKAELGAAIAGETAVSLAEIVAGINESDVIVSEIARSLDEQAEGVAQITNGINQVADVAQQNSATAEESAAASEEMSGQSAVLEGLIERFKLRSATGSPALGTGRGMY